MKTTSVDAGVARLERAMSALFRHGTLQRLHDHVAAHADIDLDRAVYLVLRRVISDGPLRITDVARDLAIDPSTASRHLQALEGRGWVTRLADPEDRRAALAAATSDGESVVARIEAERRRVLAAAVAEWDPSERDLFFDLSERFYADLTDYIHNRLT